MEINPRYGVDENLYRCAAVLFPHDAELKTIQISPTELKIFYEEKIYIYDWLMNRRSLFDTSTEEGWRREFARRMKHFMIKNVLNQNDLGRELGIPQQTISKYLTGKAKPSLGVAVRMSRVLSCTLDYLIGF